MYAIWIVSYYLAWNIHRWDTWINEITSAFVPQLIHPACGLLIWIFHQPRNIFSKEFAKHLLLLECSSLKTYFGILLKLRFISLYTYGFFREFYFRYFFDFLTVAISRQRFFLHAMSTLKTFRNIIKTKITLNTNGFFREFYFQYYLDFVAVVIIQQRFRIRIVFSENFSELY